MSEEGDDVSGIEDLSDLGGLGDSDRNPLESAEESSGSGDFSLFDASSFGLAEDEFTLDFSDVEGGDCSPQRRFEQSFAAAQGGLPKFRVGRRQKALERVEAEDFEEGPERNAFRIIKGYRDWLFEGKVPAVQVWQAIDFFFTAMTADTCDFPLCCAVLRVRPDVVRLRMQYEWWLRGTRFTGPFNFFSVPVPSMLQGEIQYYAGEIGMAIARELWVQPGMGEDELQTCLEGDGYGRPEMLEALVACEKRFLMSKDVGWYLTGRNPMLMNIRSNSIYGRDQAVGGSFHWSRLFGYKLDI